MPSLAKYPSTPNASKSHTTQTLIGIVGAPSANPALPGLRAADPQGRAEAPLLRHLARVGGAVDFGGHGAPLALDHPDAPDGSTPARPPRELGLRGEGGAVL
jgi:hypothetical protein